MSFFIKCAVAAVLALLASYSHANLANAEVAFRTGNWKVLRSVDNMTDKIDCTGIYQDNYSVQLTGDTLFIKVRGGVDGVTMRMGDKPARSMRLATDMEKRVGTVIISGNDFVEILESNRLRLSVLTVLRSSFEQDLNLTGIQEAVASIKSGCPVAAPAAQPTAPVPPAPAPVAKPEAPAPTCSETVLARMKAQGLKPAQVSAICK